MFMKNRGHVGHLPSERARDGARDEVEHLLILLGYHQSL